MITVTIGSGFRINMISTRLDEAGGSRSIERIIGNIDGSNLVVEGIGDSGLALRNEATGVRIVYAGVIDYEVTGSGEVVFHQFDLQSIRLITAGSDLIFEMAFPTLDLAPFYNGEMSRNEFNAYWRETLKGEGVVVIDNSESNVLAGMNWGDEIHGNDGNDQMWGLGGRDELFGSRGSDDLRGGDGRDMLDGGDHGDVLRGGEGDDYLFGGGGNDRLLGEAGNNVLSGDAGNDTVTGGNGNDTLSGGEGADVLAGGEGNDTYLDVGSADVIVERAGGGSDTIHTRVSMVLKGAIENAVLTVAGDLRLHGNGQDNALTGHHGENTLVGGGGDDTLNGMAGVDSMLGGIGDDLIYIDETGDVAVGASGSDTAFVNLGFGMGFVLPNDFENATLGSRQTNVTGNAHDNVILGGLHNNTLRGEGGNDHLDGGEAGIDVLAGGAGNDTLIGGSGDSLAGGGGDDVYYAKLEMKRWFTLEATGEAGNAVLDGRSLNINPTLQSGGLGISTNLYSMDGDSIADRMEIHISGAMATTWYMHVGLHTVGLDLAEGTYADASGFSRPVSGHPHLHIQPSSDPGSFTIHSLDIETVPFQSRLRELEISFEQETIFTGGGLTGTLTISDFEIVGSRVAIHEEADAGTDTLIANAASDVSGTIDLDGFNIENITLKGEGSVDVVGTAASNALIGNRGSNALDGGAGTDTLHGGAGNDLLIWDAADALLDGGSGRDMLRVSAASLDLTAVDDAKVLGVEVIHLFGEGARALTLGEADVLAMSSTDTLRILGDADDSVTVADGTWDDLGVIGGYHVYELGAARVEIAVAITSVTIETVEI